MYPGEDGKQRFLTDVRRLLGLSDTTLINVNFECAAPPALASASDAPSGGDRGADDALSCGQGSQLSLKGLETWDAAVFCATMAAAQKAATPDGTMAVRGGDGQQLQQQRLQQRLQQSQQLQSVDAVSAASETELLYWTRLGSTTLPSPRQQQQATTGALLAHHLSGPRLLLSPRQSMLSPRLPMLSPRQAIPPASMMSAGGADPGGPTAPFSASASASVSSPRPCPGDRRHFTNDAAVVIPSQPPSVLPPLARPVTVSSRLTTSVTRADRAAAAPPQSHASMGRIPPLLLRRSDKSDRPRPLLRQRLAQVWKDILPRCH